jgi:lipoprotein-releasing system permease protein
VDVLSLCLRYIVSRKIAIVSLFFIMVGVTANIVVVAVMDGFQDRIKSHLRGTESDLTVSFDGVLPFNQFERVKQELASDFASAGGPIASLAPHHFTLGIVGNQTTREGLWPEDQMQAVRIVGIDYDLEKTVVPFGRMLTDLRPEDAALKMAPEDLEDPFRERSIPGVIIGTSLARALKLLPGDRFQILTGELRSANETQPAHPGQPAAPDFKPNNLPFQLLGCFDSGRDDYDMTFVYLSLKDFERLKWGESEASHPDCRSVQVSLADPSKVAEVKAALAEKHPRLRFVSWEDKNQTLLAAVRSEKAMIVIILFFIIGIAAGSILGILYMMVIEKTRDIGILRSMGLSGRRVVGVFVGCGAILGLIGSSAGLALGLVIVKNINPIKTWLAGWPLYFEVFDEKIYRFKEIPTKIVPEWVYGTALAALALAIVAGVIPALTAARLDPVRCLKDD